MSTNELYHILHKTKELISEENIDLINHLDFSLEVILKARSENKITEHDASVLMQLAVKLMGMYDLYREFLQVDLSNIQNVKEDSTSRFVLSNNFDVSHLVNVTDELINILYAEVYQTYNVQFFTALKGMIHPDNLYYKHHSIFGTNSPNPFSPTTPIYDAILDGMWKIKQNFDPTNPRDFSNMYMVVSPVMISLLQSYKDPNNPNHYRFTPALEGSFKGPNHMMLCGTWFGAKVYSSVMYDASFSTNMSFVFVGYNNEDTPKYKPTTSMFSEFYNQHSPSTFDLQTYSVFNSINEKDFVVTENSNKTMAFFEFNFN